MTVTQARERVTTLWLAGTALALVAWWVIAC
jgi:hypothetical protein